MATSLPSAALPASGSRGLQYHTGLSAKRLPRIFFLGQDKTRPSEVNNVRICSAPVSGAILGVSRNALQARKNAGENFIPRVSRLFLPLYWCGKWRAIDRSPSFQTDPA